MRDEENKTNMKSKLFRIPLIILVLLGLVLPNFPLNLAGNRIEAEEITEEIVPEGQLFEEPEFPGEPLMPGRIEGTGTYFEIKAREYLNITLESSEEIKIVLESIPKMISIDIDSSTDATSTVLSISVLEPNKTYYKYQDSYKNEVVFVTDENGSYNLTQDLTQPHHIWLQETKGTIFLPEDCSNYGNWNTTTQTCTLTQHLTESVEITANNIILDCNSYRIIGSWGGYGIYLNNRESVTLKNCNISKYSYGIYLYYSNNNTLTGNTASNNNAYGILLRSSINNTLTGNTASNIYYGIYLYSSSNNILRNNLMLDNRYNFGISGQFDNDIDTSNLVDGKPIYYLIGASNIVIDLSSNAGTVYCIECNNITIKDLKLTNNEYGIFLYKTKDSKIENNYLGNNSFGIYLYSSNNNTLIGNTASNNGFDGIYLLSSNNNTLTDNTISNNVYYGIYLYYSSDNTFTDNTISNNIYYGIYLYPFSNNKIYHNNFKNNKIQAYVPVGNNNFDNGYPSGGNYWSDYIGVDLRSGPNQDQPGGDGIGDTSYCFTGGCDRYPFMKESGWEAPPEPQKWSFALITDLHIGGQYVWWKIFPWEWKYRSLDYGDLGWDDDATGQEYNPTTNKKYISTKYLRDAVSLINSNRNLYNIKFVVVNGDFSDSAEMSELNKAKEILNTLEIPWIPIIGNHDIWPYVSVIKKAPEEISDKYFNDIFNSQYQKLISLNLFQNWEKEDIPVWNPEVNPQHNSYFQNLAFDYNDYHFIGLDFNTRDDAPSGEGVMPEADLYDKIPNGTWGWLTTHLTDYLNKHPDSRENIILLGHHPFSKLWLPELYPFEAGFSENELDTISNFLINYKDKVYAEFAGHTHQTKDYEWHHKIMQIIETDANYEKSLVRVVQIYPEGKIDYSKMLGYSMLIKADSPVDLVIIDPDNLTVSKQLNEIPGATYIELDEDGALHDLITIPERKLGDYQIKVIPEPGATSTDTFTLEVSILEDSFGYTPIVLAEDVPIEEIPTQPYIFESKEKQSTQLTYTEDLIGQFSDPINLNATLTDRNGNLLSNKLINFTIGAQTVSAITNFDGVATASLVLDQTPGRYYFVETSFDGDVDYLPAFISQPFEILKENVTINVLDREGFYDDNITLEANIRDDDGQFLLQEPKEIEFKIGNQIIGTTTIDELGKAEIGWRVNLIPKELTEIYPTLVTFAGNEYYSSATGSTNFTLNSAKWLKEYAIKELKSAKTGNKRIDQEIDRIIKHIENSLNKDLWLDASHLVFFQKDCFDPKMIEINFDGLDFEKLFELKFDKVEQGMKTTFKGKCLGKKLGIRVFHEEYIATKLMLTELKGKPRIPEELKNAFEEVITKLVKADTLLVKISLYDAKNTSVKNPKFRRIVEHQIKKSEEELVKAEKELSENRPDKAISRLAKSWLHSQLAIKFANLKKLDF